MSNNIKIRIATRDDAKRIAEFNVLFAKETEDKNIPIQVTEKGVHNVFSKFNNGFYVVAEIEKKIVGVSMITREWSDWSNGAYYCIQNIFVNHEENEQEIHDEILEKVKLLAKEHDEICGIRLYVLKDDEKTQKMYKKLGLEKTPYRLFECNF